MRSRVASRLAEPHTEADEVREFATGLEDAVRLRMRSDVPIGTCLSGGLDSSTIACIANRLISNDATSDHLSSIGDRQKTFSSCFNDPRFDEREYIETVLEATGAEKNYVFPDGQARLWEELPQVIWHQEEPFGSTSIYAQWNVMRRARERGVTVLLDGQGGDELLAGYDWYYNLYLAELLRRGRLATLIREATSIKAVSAGSGNLNYLLMGFLLALPLWLRPAVNAIQLVNQPERKPVSLRVLSPSFASRHSDRIPAHRRETARAPRDVWHKLYLDTTLTSLPALLRYEDRNSMAFSLEARVPFLDYRVVEHVFSLPSSFKLREGWSKWLLRQATASIVPDKIRFRRDKMGFVTPEVVWLRESRERLSELFSGKDVLSSPYLDPKAVNENLQLWLSRGQVGDSEAWRWINLELWLRRFFGG
jgi:asparagine synthase (glutamine-hydrolysing)